MIGSATRARAFLGAVGTVVALCVWGSLSTAPAGPAATAPAASVPGRASARGPAAGPAPVAADTAAATGAAAASPSGVHPVVYTSASPGQAAAVAVTFALRQIGLPYVWGGDGPAAGDAGFDCSGLTHAAYAAAGIVLPRTAQTQYDAGPHLPAGTVLQAGDLVFYGTPARVHHVGIALDAHRMVNAPTFGEPVQVASIRGTGDDYVGATRPAAGVGGPLVLPAPVVARIAAVPVTSGPPPAAAPAVAVAAASAVAATATAAAAVPPAAVPAVAPTAAVPTTPTPPTAPSSTAPAPAAPSSTVPAPAGPSSTVPSLTVPSSVAAAASTSAGPATTNPSAAGAPAAGTATTASRAGTGSGSVPAAQGSATAAASHLPVAP